MRSINYIAIFLILILNSCTEPGQSLSERIVAENNGANTDEPDESIVENAGHDAPTTSDSSGELTVNVGPDKYTNGSVSISATAAGTTPLTYVWSKISGTGSITFSDNASAEVIITMSLDGIYLIRLTVTDANGNSAYDEVNIVKDTVPPSINIGDDIITNGEITISAITSEASGLTYSWSKISGSGTITFGSPFSKDTAVTASDTGDYVLRLTATDLAGNSSFDELTLTRTTLAPNPGIFLASTSGGATSFTLNWSAATDLDTETADLRYMLCSGSNVTSINTVEKCEAATVEMPYTTNALSHTITGKTAGTIYFYNVVVKDSSDQKSLYDGRTQALGISLAYTFSGLTDNSKIGEVLSRAGDVNGDGKADFIIGDPLSTAGGCPCGAAFVYSGATGEIIYSFVGTEDNTNFGNAVAGGGDVNGDGTPDIVIANNTASGGGALRGQIKVFSGATGAVIYTHNGSEDSASLGYAVAMAGDANGDGNEDYLVKEVSTGKVYLYSGATGQSLFVFDNPHGLAVTFGNSLAGIGDITHDGKAEIIIGDRAVTGPGANSGEAYVFNGASGEIIFTIPGTEVGGKLGYLVSGAGDVNGDGTLDFIVGEPGKDASEGGLNSGTAYVHSGATGTVLYTIPGASINSNLGVSCSFGDVNNDGRSDFIIGEAGAPAGGTFRGQVYIYSGATGTILHTISGVDDSAKFGTKVDGLGDINGDGKDDFIIGAPFSPEGGTNRGKAFIYLSPSD